MAQPLKQWLKESVYPHQEKSIRWLSEKHFFRDPMRGRYSDTSFFFSPADGVVLYSKVVEPDQSVVEIKGVNYSLQDALQDKNFQMRSLVIGIFMTTYDVHVNRIPYPGRLKFRLLDPIKSFNYPLIDAEKELIKESYPSAANSTYLWHNQRMLNSVFSAELALSYYLLQIADYDVNSITPFCVKQNTPYYQNQRFSQIRFGSQLDLIIPLSSKYEFEPLVGENMHVEAGLDPLVRVSLK